MLRRRLDDHGDKVEKKMCMPTWCIPTYLCFPGGEIRQKMAHQGWNKNLKNHPVPFIFKKWATQLLYVQDQIRENDPNMRFFANHRCFSRVLWNRHISLQDRQWSPPMHSIVWPVYKIPELADEIVTASQEHLRQDFSVLSHNMPGGNGLRVVWGDNRCP